MSRYAGPRKRNGQSESRRNSIKKWKSNNTDAVKRMAQEYKSRQYCTKNLPGVGIK